MGQAAAPCPAGGCTESPASCPCRAVEDGLTYQYRKVRAPVLQVLQVFFKVCGKQGHPIMRKVRGSDWGREAVRFRAS